MGKGVAGGGTTSEGGQWEMQGWSRGNVSWLLLSSGSALGISSAAAFGFSRGAGPGGEAGTCHPGGATGEHQDMWVRSSLHPYPCLVSLGTLMGLEPQESSRDSRQQDSMTSVSG